MPIIDVTVQEGALGAAELASLPEKLGHIALEHEGLAGSAFAERFTWIYVHEVPRANVTQVAGPPPKPLYRLRLTTLQTLLDNDSKVRLGQALAKAIYELEDSPWNADEAHNRIWTFFEDVREGDWMAGDRINSTRAIREALEAEKACTPTHCEV